MGGSTLCVLLQNGSRAGTPTWGRVGDRVPPSSSLSPLPQSHFSHQSWAHCVHVHTRANGGGGDGGTLVEAPGFGAVGGLRREGGWIRGESDRGSTSTVHQQYINSTSAR